MQLSEYASCDAVELAALIKKGEINAKEVTALACAGIDAANPKLNAVIEVFEDRRDGPDSGAERHGALYGVPILNKDLSFAEVGRRQEMGSIFAKGFVPKTDSTTVERLRAAGLNILGRTTTPEFGNAGLTESAIAGVTRNPWDPDRTPGGSSGGSAAMVAAGAVPIATASDGGGSTRTPASVCGLVGLKPTRGLVPVGPGRGEGSSGLVGSFAVTRTMRDCAALLDVMGGPAPGDPYIVKQPDEPFQRCMERPLPPLRIAYTEENWAGVSTSKESRTALRKALQVLADAGHIVDEAAPVFDWERFFEATIVVMCSNLATGIDSLSTALNRKPRDDELQASTWACYRLGKSYSAIDLLTALGQFNDVSRSFGRFFQTYDVLATPTNVFPAPRLEDCYSCDPTDPIDGATYQTNVYSNDHFVALANTTGQPSITIPVHETADGLPLGVQFVARHAEDAVLLRTGNLLEQSLPWASRRPRVHVEL